MSSEIQNLLKQGIEAARAGDKDTARSLFLQVTEADMNNERAWLWLANIAEDEAEQRVYLANVLQINPENERAQKMIERLDGKSKASSHDDEIIPGVPRKQAILYGGITGAVYLLIMVSLLITGASRRSTFNNQRAATVQAIALAETSIAQQETESALLEQSITQTSAAILALTSTATPTERPNALPTLPPTWTPTPPPEENVDNNGATLIETTPLPAPPSESLVGHIIVGYGGADRLRVDFYEMFGVELDNPGQIQPIGTNLVNNVTIDKSNGRTLVYTRYYPNTFDFAIERSGFSGGDGQRLANTWEPYEFIIEQEDARYSLDGTKIVFIAPILDTNTREVWMLDLDLVGVPNQSALKRITNDNSDYANPDISPDNTQIIAVKFDSEGLVAETDVVSIMVDGGNQTPVTIDGNQNIESHPRWSPDGNEIAYAAYQQGDESQQNDIIRLNMANPDAPARFVARNPQWDEKLPVYSPDGRYVAYASNQTGVYNVFVHEIESGALYQVTLESENSYYPNDWYQPGVVPERPVVAPLPTPVIIPTEAS